MKEKSEGFSEEIEFKIRGNYPEGKIQKHIPKKIEWEDIEKYMNKPVYDNTRKKWKILAGYKNYNGYKMVIFTDEQYWDDEEDCELYEGELD